VNRFGIVLRRLDIGRKQLQLPALALLIEDFDGLQPARLRRVIQLTQITQGSLARTIGRAHRFHERPIGVILPVLASRVLPKKYRQDTDTPFNGPTRGLVCTTSTFRTVSTENTNLGGARNSKTIKIAPAVTNLG
jgi:hypothetical protein